MTHGGLQWILILKIISFSRDYVTPAAIYKGCLARVTGSYDSDYKSPQKIGIAINLKALDIETQSLKALKEYADKTRDQFQPLFLTLSNSNKPRFKKR